MGNTSTVAVAQPSAEAQRVMAAQQARARKFVIKSALVWVGVFIVLGVAFKLLKFDINFMYDRKKWS